MEYAYDSRPDWMAADDHVQREWLFEDVVAATRTAMKVRYERVVLVGKSLGTVALQHLLKKENFPRRTKAARLTPVLDDPALRRRLEESVLPSCVVIGSNDHYYDEVFLARLRNKKSMELEVIEGADHLLETDEGTLASIDIAKRVTKSFEHFSE